MRSDGQKGWRLRARGEVSVVRGACAKDARGFASFDLVGGGLLVTEEAEDGDDSSLRRSNLSEKDLEALVSSGVLDCAGLDLVIENCRRTHRQQRGKARGLGGCGDDGLVINPLATSSEKMYARM